MQFLVMHRDEMAADVYISEDHQRVIGKDFIEKYFTGKEKFRSTL